MIGCAGGGGGGERLAHLYTAILCVRCRPQLTAGKQGEEQRGGGEVQLYISSSSSSSFLYLSLHLHLTRRDLQSASNWRRDNT